MGVLYKKSLCVTTQKKMILQLEEEEGAGEAGLLCFCSGGA
jgi:hypothetical protein